MMDYQQAYPFAAADMISMAGLFIVFGFVAFLVFIFTIGRRWRGLAVLAVLSVLALMALVLTYWTHEVRMVPSGGYHQVLEVHDQYEPSRNPHRQSTIVFVEQEPTPFHPEWTPAPTPPAETVRRTVPDPLPVVWRAEAQERFLPDRYTSMEDAAEDFARHVEPLVYRVLGERDGAPNEISIYF